MVNSGPNLKFWALEIFPWKTVSKEWGYQMKYRSLEITQTFKSLTIFTHFSASFDNWIEGHSNFVKISFVRMIEVSRPWICMMYEQPQLGHNRRALVKNEVQRKQGQEVPRRTNVHWPKMHRDELFYIK